MKRMLSALFFTTVLMTAGFSISALSGGWTTNNAGKQIYQNDDGRTVTNSWIKSVENGNNVWYYATSDGSIRRGGWQKIDDSYYYFDTYGIMQTGWVDGDNYYCDPVNGAMKTGWKQLPLPEGTYQSNNWSGADTYWFYFNTKNGQKFKSDGSYVTTKNIDGAVYGFDENGAMVIGWAETESGDPDITGYMYFAERTEGNFRLGQRVAGTWYATVGPESDDGGFSKDLSTGEVEWFYFRSNGHPAAGSDDIYDVQRINGKKFLFNEKGNPVYGIQKGVTSQEDTQYYFYYCGSSKEDCSVKTGRMNLIEDDGEKIVCYFEANGKGFTGIKNECLYYQGKLQAASSDMGYAKIDYMDDTYVVNSSGKIMRSKKKVKDKNGVKFSTDGKGALIEEIDGELEHLTLTEPQITDIS